MKKIISSVLLVTLLSTPASALADNTEEMEKLLVSVKSRIMNTDVFPQFKSDSRTIGTETVYNFSWSDYGETDYKSLDVSCNSEEVITSYAFCDSREMKKKKPFSIKKTKRTEALKAAKEAVKKLNPQIYDTLEIYDTAIFESIDTQDYGFNIQRYKDSIPVFSDTGSINLNHDCSLGSFYMDYTTGLTFENAENPIDKDSAKKEFTQKIGADLYYMTYYDSNEPEIRLVYTPKGDNCYIHAVTKDVVEISPVNSFYKNSAMGSYSIDSAGGSNYRGQLSDAELKNVLELESLLSKEETDKIIRDCKYFAFPDTAILENTATYYNADLKTYVYNFDYRIHSDYANVITDAKTGEILHFTRTSDNHDNSDADPEKIKVLSTEIMEAFSNDKAQEFRANASNDDTKFNMTYTRYINDIPFYEDKAIVAFDTDYNLTIYTMSYHNADFPAPENIISSEKATDILDTFGDYRLYYIGDRMNEKFIPVYSFTETHTIDAFTGKEIYETSEDDEKPNYTDIDGHYAEDKIKELASYGIFLDGTELHPDDAITQKDFIALLSIVFHSRSVSVLRDSYSVEMLYKTLPQDFLSEDEITPEMPLTRSTAARLMVKAMGAEEYAELPSIYAPIYNDVEENIGYINILTGLNVVSGDGFGNFNPQKEITKAQALIMIYNYLSR